MSSTVGDLEEISTPVGTFQAIKVSVKTETLDDTGYSSGVDISWYAPDIQRTIKSVIKSTNSQGKQESQVIQVIQYNLGQ